MTAKHSPLPWERDSAPGQSAIILSATTAIAEVLPNRPAAENEANAAYIVRACNAHDDLLAALRSLMTAYRDTIGLSETDPPVTWDAYGEYWAARAAIAKADGGLADA